MAFDEQLTERARAALTDVTDLQERKMFGGLAFLVSGHMACGIVGDELMLRLGAEGADAALDEPNVRPMDFTGKPLRTMVFVEPAGLQSDQALAAWVEGALSFVRTPPPHPATVRARRL